MSQRRMRMTPGYDTALVRMDPTGKVIVTTGTCGHGQGHETTTRAAGPSSPRRWPGIPRWAAP